MAEIDIHINAAPIAIEVSGAQGPAGVEDPRAAFGTNKATIVNADRIAILDSANSNLPKHTLWSVIKSTLKAYFDTLYPSGSGTSTGTNTGDQTSVPGNAGTVTTISGRISAGTNVTLAGEGTAASPYVIGSIGGGSDTPPSILPPEDPADGEPWLEYGTWILSYWSDEEGAWIVPTTNSIPATAFRSPSGLPYTSPSGEYYLAAAA